MIPIIRVSFVGISQVHPRQDQTSIFVLNASSLLNVPSRNVSCLDFRYYKTAHVTAALQELVHLHLLKEKYRIPVHRHKLAYNIIL